VHGLGDAGWLLDIAPFDGGNEALRSQIQTGLSLWSCVLVPSLVSSWSCS
jgi:hypothetical protein